MTEEEARKLLRTLNETEYSWPTGYEADGFQIGPEWVFEYCGSDRWELVRWLPGLGWERFYD
jgi:hypothetical protein